MDIKSLSDEVSREAYKLTSANSLAEMTAVKESIARVDTILENDDGLIDDAAADAADKALRKAKLHLSDIERQRCENVIEPKVAMLQEKYGFNYTQWPVENDDVVEFNKYMKTECGETQKPPIPRFIMHALNGVTDDPDIPD